MWSNHTVIKPTRTEYVTVYLSKVSVIITNCYAIHVGAYGSAVLCRKKCDNSEVILKQIPMIDLNASERRLAINEVKYVMEWNPLIVISFKLKTTNLIYSYYRSTFYLCLIIQILCTIMIASKSRACWLLKWNTLMMGKITVFLCISRKYILNIYNYWSI